MLKKIALPGIVMAVLLMISGSYHKANAAVRFGISVGQPVYTYPVDPYAYSYQDPYAYPYYDPYYYSTPAPVYVYPRYVAPSYGFSFGFGGHRGHEWREHEFREHHDRGFGRSFGRRR
jgi:hypothetical protein